MTSSWASNGPKSKVVNTHYHVAVFYGISLALYILSSAFTYMTKRTSLIDIIVDVIFAIIFVALIFIHVKASAAAEKDKKWVPITSMVLAVPLLIIFPIGTFFGVKLIINAIKLRTNSEITA